MVNAGKSRDKAMLRLLRELAFWAASHEVHVKARYIAKGGEQAARLSEPVERQEVSRHILETSRGGVDRNSN